MPHAPLSFLLGQEEDEEAQVYKYLLTVVFCCQIYTDWLTAYLPSDLLILTHERERRRRLFISCSKWVSR